MNDAAERIRAALSKSEATRHSDKPAEDFDTPAEVETTLPLLGVTIGTADASQVALPQSKIIFEEPPKGLEPPKATPAPVVTVGRTPEPARSRRIPLIIGALVALAGLTAFLLRDRWLPQHAAVSTVPSPSSAPVAARPLQVEVTAAGNGLISVRWNPATPAIVHAREGRMVITEESQAPRVLALTPEQLRSGSLNYPTTAPRLDLRLEIVDGSGATIQESIVALAGPPPQAPAEPVPPTPAPVDKVKSVPKSETADPKLLVAKVEPPPPPAPAVRQFTPPPATQRTTPVASTVLLEPTSAIPVASTSRPTAGLPDKMPSVPAPAAPVAPVRPVTVVTQPGGKFLLPKLVKRIAPTYPSLAKSFRVEGTVHLTATIRPDGTVQNVQIVSGHKMLVPAATAAVRQWIYKPATLNGKPVEVVTQMDVKFALNE